jgi:hypothetical protein
LLSIEPSNYRFRHRGASLSPTSAAAAAEGEAMGFLDGLRLDTLLKRVCKSLLKKRLGDLILGDLDLDQFDIQLGRGTLQLNDLALNAEFINHKARFLPHPPACVLFSHVYWSRRSPLPIKPIRRRRGRLGL